MNLGQIRTAIQQRGYGTDTATAQTELINSCYRRICGMRRWPWLEIADNQFTLLTAGEGYPLSTITDLLHLEAVRVEDTSNTTTRPLLEYLPPQQFRDVQHFNPSETGVPQFWTRMGSYLYVWPDIDKQYVLHIDYIRQTAPLANDSDTPVIPTTYHDVLVWGAISELTFRERDIAGYDLATERYNRILNDMVHEYDLRQRKDTSRVVSSGFHDQFDSEFNPWLSS